MIIPIELDWLCEEDNLSKNEILDLMPPKIISKKTFQWNIYFISFPNLRNNEKFIKDFKNHLYVHDLVNLKRGHSIHYIYCSEIQQNVKRTLRNVVNKLRTPYDPIEIRPAVAIHLHPCLSLEGYAMEVFFEVRG